MQYKGMNFGGGRRHISDNRTAGVTPSDGHAYGDNVLLGWTITYYRSLTAEYSYSYTDELTGQNESDESKQRVAEPKDDA